MDFAVIEGPPDEIVHLKYIEEARPRETGEGRERITAPNLYPPAPPPPPPPPPPKEKAEKARKDHGP